MWDDIPDWLGWNEPAALYVVVVPGIAGLLVAAALGGDGIQHGEGRLAARQLHDLQRVRDRLQVIGLWAAWDNDQVGSLGSGKS